MTWCFGTEAIRIYGIGNRTQRPCIWSFADAARDKSRKVKRLLELGADINANIDDEYTGGRTPVHQAVLSRQYDIALQLLEAGADYKTYRPKPSSDRKLIHTVVAIESSLPDMTEEQRMKFRKLLTWLEEHGESAAAAREDRARSLQSR